MNIDWGQVTALLIVGVIAYLWKQSRKVDLLDLTLSGKLDKMKQALIGFEGKGGGVMDEIKTLRQRTHDLTSAMSSLNLTVTELNAKLDVIAAREDNR